MYILRFFFFWIQSGGPAFILSLPPQYESRCHRVFSQIRNLLKKKKKKQVPGNAELYQEGKGAQWLKGLVHRFQSPSWALPVTLHHFKIHLKTWPLVRRGELKLLFVMKCELFLLSHGWVIYGYSEDLEHNSLTAPIGKHLLQKQN